MIVGLEVVAGLAAIGWLVVLGRLLFVVGPVAPIRALHAGPTRGPSALAVVAARDEGRDVEACIRSLLSQDYPSLAIVAVDDQSTDATGPILDAIAAEPEARGRLRVIHGRDRPAGWLGKTWAVHQGVEGASADWLWFVDGDMRLHPQALATAIDEAVRGPADLVSILPEMRPETFWQGSIALVVAAYLTHLHPLSRVNDPRRPLDALAAGGFCLVRRSLYEAVGGHESVRGEVVEDIQLARRIKAIGGRLRVAPGVAIGSTHAYGSVPDIVRGLRKNAFAILDYRAGLFATLAVGLTLMAWIPPVAAIAGLASGPIGRRLASIGGAGWGLMALNILPFVAVMRLSPIQLVGFPLGVSLYAWIAERSVADFSRGVIRWKGQTYDANSIRAAPARRGPGRAGADPASAAAAIPESTGPASPP